METRMKTDDGWAVAAVIAYVLFCLIAIAVSGG